jgi:hypothetical protein
LIFQQSPAAGRSSLQPSAKKLKVPAAISSKMR